MSARMVDGWLAVDYTGPELVVIEIGIGRGDSIAWQPAYLDWIGGRRVAKIRRTGVDDLVWLRVHGTVTRVGKITP